MKELIVQDNKQILEQALRPFGIIIPVYLFILIGSILLFGTRSYLALGFDVLFGFMLVMTMYGYIYLVLQVRSKDPALIMNDRGVTIRYYGLIPWHEVEEFTLYNYGGSPIELIGISVKDSFPLSKQSTWQGKMAIWMTKLFNRYPINLGNLELPNETVVRFAHQYLKNIGNK